MFTPVGAHREVFENGVHGFSFIPGELENLKTSFKKTVLSRPKICDQEIGNTNRRLCGFKFFN